MCINTFYLSIHCSVDLLPLFWLSWIMSLWTLVYKLPVWVLFFIILGVHLEAPFQVWITCNSLFSILRNHHNVFYRVCTILQSHQQCIKFPIFLHPCQYFLFSFVFVVAIIMHVKAHFYLLIYFWLDWSLNSGICSCKAGVVPLETPPFYF
jgi:hypothetical protein